MVQQTLFSLESTDASQDLEANEVERLSAIVVEKAEGVFLWVKLALTSIQRGLMYYESFSELKNRLGALPGELRDLFIHLLERIEPEHRRDCARYIKLLRAKEQVQGEGINALVVAFTDMKGTKTSHNTALDLHAVQRLCRTAEKRVLLRR